MDTIRTATSVLQDASKVVLEALREDAPKILRRIGRKAVFEAKALAPEGKTKRLVKSITSKVTMPFANVVELEVGATDQKAHLFELGTVQRVQEKTGRKTGKIFEDPFIGPATEKLPQFLEVELVKLAKRLESKGIKK